MDLIKDEIRTFNKDKPLDLLQLHLLRLKRLLAFYVLGASAMATYHTTAIERLGASYAANYIR
ncbi:hypothetical protein LSUB1_G008104 [Lachnellula subtilissima]|uniref:Uncharacterized protein n=1 Tax=Lachnellula subtilissima TaxID=602034 RepID=A0A8H8RAQ9_9HELO|nr:hypothetical protein LSUB1_G008104 [Lachnellula subtilissima]